MTSGTSTIVETSPQWPPASVPCTTRISTPAATWTQRVLLGSDQGRDRNAVFPAHFDHRLWRYTERIGDQPDRMTERGFEHFQRPRRVKRLRRIGGNGGGRELDAMSLEEVAGEVTVFGRNPSLQAPPGDIVLTRSRDVFRDQHVQAVGLAVDVIVDPLQLLLDGLGRMCRGAEHAEPSGPAHGGDDVAAMAEGEQRKLDAQHLADRRLHP
jgi:hypothetical protein